MRAGRELVRFRYEYATSKPRSSSGRRAGGAVGVACNVHGGVSGSSPPSVRAARLVITSTGSTSTSR